MPMAAHGRNAALDSAISETCPSGEDILFLLCCGLRCGRRPVAWVPEAGPARAGRKRRGPGGAALNKKRNSEHEILRPCGLDIGNAR